MEQKRQSDIHEPSANENGSSCLEAVSNRSSTETVDSSSNSDNNLRKSCSNENSSSCLVAPARCDIRVKRLSSIEDKNKKQVTTKSKKYGRSLSCSAKLDVDGIMCTDTDLGKILKVIISQII